MDLCAGLDLHLDPGQADIITDGTAERADGKWLASEVVDTEPRQNGKGSILEARALGGLLLVKEPLIIWTAHEFKTAHQGFLRMRHYFDNYDDLRKRVKTIRSSTHSTEIMLTSGQVLAFLARSGGSGRGFAEVSPLFLDEAYALTEEQMAALVFATSAHPNPQVWYMSSAPLTDSAVLRNLVLRGRRGSRTMVAYEWSAAGRRQDLERVVRQNKELSEAESETPAGRKLRRQLFELVAQANRAFGVRISEDSIIRELGSTGVEQFTRERLGGFSEEEEGGAIDPDRWNALADPESRRDGAVALAVDVARNRDWAAISMYGLREDGIGHSQLVDYRPGTDWIIGSLEEFNVALNPIAIGMGRGTFASLRERLKAAGFIRPEDRPIDRALQQADGVAHPPQRGDLAVLNGTEMAAACGGFIDAVRHGTLRHVPSEQFTAAVKAGKTRNVGDAMAWVFDEKVADGTALVGATAAKWSFEARINAVPESDYDPLNDFF